MKLAQICIIVRLVYSVNMLLSCKSFKDLQAKPIFKDTATIATVSRNDASLVSSNLTYM